jgi:hypothetical protein
MSTDPTQPTTYRDLNFQKGCIANTQVEFDYVYVGSRNPPAGLTKDFLDNAQSLHLLYAGRTRVNGTTGANANNLDAVILLFLDKKALQNFLDRPIAPSMNGISLVLGTSREPRL